MTLATQGHVYWKNKPKFQLEADTDSHWVMYIIESGQCRFNFDKFSGIAKANDTLLIPPYTLFEREMLLPMTFHFIRITSTLDLDSHLVGHHHFNTARFTENCTMLQKTSFNLNPTAITVRNHIVSDFFILKAIPCLKTEQTQVTQQKNQVIAKAINLMHSDLKLTISEIAQLSDVNSSYFSRHFKHIMGETAINFYTKLKLRKVQELLITTDESLTEIADKTGFSDAFYLSRVFSQHLKCSPSTFRKKHII